MICQAMELESRDFLSTEEQNVVEFVNTLETMYSQLSFTEAKENLKNNDQKDRFVDNCVKPVYIGQRLS